MVSVFPTEIYEYIIDAVGHSWKPHRTLRSCALTCRAWLPRSRMNIFRSMSFASVGAEGIHKFSQILDDAPHLQLLVEEVKVSMSDHPLGAGPQTREAIEILPIILWGKLPVLRTLRISAINRNTTPLALHRLFFPCLSQFSTITTLALYHVTYSRFRDFAQMLHALRNLRTVECGQVGWLAWSHYQFPTMRIARLSLVEAYDVESNRIDKLHLRRRGVWNLLTALGVSLEDLTLDITEFGPFVLESQSIDIPRSDMPCTSIHTLRLNAILDPAHISSVKAAANAVSNTGFTRLHTVIVSLVLPAKHESSTTIDYVHDIGKHLDPVLSRWSTRNLAQCVFDVPQDMVKPDIPWSELVATAFPSCGKQGLLRFRYYRIYIDPAVGRPRNSLEDVQA